MITRFYYSLNDLNTIATGKDTGCFYTINKGFFDFLSIVLPASAGRIADDEITTEFFQNYIWPRFYEETIDFIDVEHDPWEEVVKPMNKNEVLPQVQSKLVKIWSWLQESKQQYETLINLYTEQKDNLMKQLSSKATTLFNDTPQTADDVTTTGYITTATTATTTADAGTPMTRLKEIRDNLENLYGSWSNEFRKFINW